jgi:hypothetical protein
LAVRIQLLIIAVLGALVAQPSSLFGQSAKSDLTQEEKHKIIIEENRKEAHQTVLEAFKKLKTAYAAKQKADCDGTDEEKKKADQEYVRAREHFRSEVYGEALLSEAWMKANDEYHEAAAENEAAKKNPTIPAAYKEEAAKKLKEATDKENKVQKQEEERILREYQTELKEMEKEKCPAKTDKETMVPRSGGYLGGELVKSWGSLRSTERLADTGETTNQFNDRADPVGGGFLIGYKFAPWGNNIIVSPFASFDFVKRRSITPFPMEAISAPPRNSLAREG